MGQGLPLGLAWRGESGLFITPDTAREMFTAQNGGPYGLGAAIADSRGSLIVMKGRMSATSPVSFCSPAKG